MAQATHGGARPKQREDDGRTHNSGPGRKPASMTIKLGQKLFVATKDANGNPVDGALWTVADMDRSWLTIHSDNGDTIRIRR